VHIYNILRLYSEYTESSKYNIQDLATSWSPIQGFLTTVLDLVTELNGKFHGGSQAPNLGCRVTERNNIPHGYNKTYRIGNANEVVLSYSSYQVKLTSFSFFFLYPGFGNSHIRVVKYLLNVTNIFETQIIRLKIHIFSEFTVFHAKLKSKYFTTYIYFEWPPLWSSGQNVWLLTGAPGSILCVARFFRAAVGLERGPLSLVSNLRSYLEEIVAAPGLQNRSYDRRDSLRWPRDPLYPLKLALASLTGGDRSIGIVLLRTQNHGVIFISNIRTVLCKS
jgi:hypothetical protein